MAARALTWAAAVAARALAGIGTRTGTGVIGVPAGPMVIGNATKPRNGGVGVPAVAAEIKVAVAAE